MGIRFSMKWLLAGMVYVALAAAAFSQTHWAWADGLWVASFIALCYAAALAFNACGNRQARAVGFLVGGVSLLIAIQCSPDSVPLGRIVDAFWPDWTITYAAPTPLTSSNPFPTYSVNSRMAYPTPEMGDFIVKRRAANAVGIMVAGLIGAILSAVAYRQAHPRTDPT